MKQEEYEKEFGIQEARAKGNPDKTRDALEHALDIRKFEIGLYWQRAAYFWALIAAAFAGYFAILSSDSLENKELLAFLVSCIGLVFTWAWFQVNRGSKYWQENWENHVDMLENPITGPLYKTTMHRPGNDRFLEKHVTGPKAISVSKINQLVSLFTLIHWSGLLIYAVLETTPTWLSVSGEALFFITTIIFICMLYKSAATFDGDQEHIAKRRKTIIIGP